MQRTLVMLAAILFLGSCGGSSNPDRFRSDQGYEVYYNDLYYVNVEVPFEDAWAAVRIALRELEWEIESEDVVSGTVITREQTIGTNRDRYACRQWPGSTTRVDEMGAKLSIHVGQDDSMITHIRAMADIQGRYTYISSTGEERIAGWWSCVSTGELESELFDAALVKLEPLRFVAPVYKRR